jgi:Aerotolerance regulator N-terminal/von Willebrand factor type A domain
MNLQPFFFAVGFTNLAMLGWLAAAAAPLLIHLWSRHRYREAPWAAMQFLLAAMRKNARRLQLQQWLLLAVRTLLIALVVLAVAEPYGEQLVAGGASAPAHKVLAIDGSLSMAYSSDSASHFDRAKKLAADLVRNSRAGDTFTIIFMASPAKTILGRESVDNITVAAQIESLSQTHAAADLPATFRLIQDALSKNAKRNNSPRRQEVYFFTDLQRATWQGAASPLAAAGSSPAIAAIAERAKLFVVDVGEPDAANLAVTQLTTSEPFVTLNHETVFEVRLHEFGREPRADCRVELLVDDVAVGEQTVDVPAGGEVTVQFSHRFTAAGRYALAVRAEGDRLEPDNRRWLVVPVREEIRALCVEGSEGAAKYVADALNPNADARSAIRPVVVSEGDLAELALTEFDCVFFCNVAQLTAGEAQRLARYAAEGGGIIFFLGDRVVPEAYSRIAASSHADRGNEMSLLPARIGALVTESHFGLDPLEYRHKIVEPFRGSELAGLLTTPVSRYFELDLTGSARNVEVAAAIGAGHPFIVTAPLGKGRTVLVATDGSLSSVDPATGEPWTIWPTWPSFLPIVRELLAYAVSGQEEEWQRSVGSALESGDLVDAGAAPKIVRPDGRIEPVALHTAQGGLHWSYSETDLAGLYSLARARQNESQQFAVNVDTRESDLAKVDLQQLPPELAVRSTLQSQGKNVPGTLLSHAAWSGRLLSIALGLLFIESFLAWRFGRGTA